MDKKAFINCNNQIQSYIHKTPILTSSFIDKMIGGELYFKCENFQKTGSFKIRGAMNAVLQLTDKEKSRGVVTHSSGNFAQALSLAAKKCGVKAFIVMPKNAAQVKKEAVVSYGGIITESENNVISRELLAQRIVTEKGTTFIHPSNQQEVIVGQGTACMELLEEVKNLDTVIAPVGGGGLIAGTALACHYFENSIEVYGAEPMQVDDAYRSLLSGKIEQNEATDTIADGLKTQLGDVNFPILQQHLKTIIRVEEHEIIAAMKLIFEKMKIVVEPSSAVVLAAILKNKEEFKGKKIGVILSGGNVDVELLDNIRKKE